MIVSRTQSGRSVVVVDVVVVVRVAVAVATVITPTTTATTTTATATTTRLPGEDNHAPDPDRLRDRHSLAGAARRARLLHRARAQLPGRLWMMRREAPKLGLDRGRIFDLWIDLILWAVVGSRVLHVIATAISTNT